MTLLIFTPTWIDPETGEDAIQPDVAAAIKDQVGVDFYWHVTSDNPYPIGDYRNVLHQYRQAREWFLITHDEHGLPYEALVTIEHDNVLPDPEAVKRLSETPGDVIYAPYMLRHGTSTLSTWQYINDRNLGMSLTNYRAELSQARERIVHRISGTGFGCTLIRRHVLEAIGCRSGLAGSRQRAARERRRGGVLPVPAPTIPSEERRVRLAGGTSPGERGDAGHPSRKRRRPGPAG